MDYRGEQKQGTGDRPLSIIHLPSSFLSSARRSPSLPYVIIELRKIGNERVIVAYRII